MPRRPDAVEPAFQDGREAVPPGREYQHQRLGFGETRRFAGNGRGVEGGGVIALALGLGQRRFKSRAVKILDRHLMAGRFEPFSGKAGQRPAEAVRQGVGDDDKAFHGGDSGQEGRANLACRACRAYPIPGRE